MNKNIDHRDACDDAPHAVITGGAGFIGSHLTDALLRLGMRVTVVDSLVDGARSNVDPQARFVRASVDDAVSLKTALLGADYVFHLAATASVPKASADPQTAFAANAQGCVDVLEAVRHVAPRATVLLASSGSVYGDAADGVGFAEDARLNPASVYASSKLCAEAVFAAYGRAYDMRTRVVRFANVYGPRQSRYVLHDLCARVATADERVAIYGSGRESRDFIYVADAVRAVVTIGLEPEMPWNTFNVGTGRQTTIVDLARVVARAYGKPHLRFEPTETSWLGDIHALSCDVSRLAAIGAAAAVTIEDGVERYVAWTRAATKTAVRANAVPA